MSLAIAAALVVIVLSVVAMLVPLWGPPSRHRVAGSFATLNFGAAALVSSLRPVSWVTSAMQWLFIIVGLAFFVGEVRAWRSTSRELKQRRH